MKAPLFYTLFLFLIYFSTTTTNAHPPESSQGLNDTLQYRKLYLHIDRDHYFLGDTIWFKAYYLDGQLNKFIPGLISIIFR